MQAVTYFQMEDGNQFVKYKDDDLNLPDGIERVFSTNVSPETELFLKNAPSSEIKAYIADILSNN